MKIDQAVIGSCTNGRIEDMRIAAEILKGRKVADGVRAIVMPATQEVELQCIREGLAEIFIEAGAIISTPTCGPCLGGHMGILAAGERAISTTNRNFVGRMATWSRKCTCPALPLQPHRPSRATSRPGLSVGQAA